MRILYLAYANITGHAAAPIHVREIVNNLSTQGNELIVVGYHTGDGEVSDFLSPSIVFHSVGRLSHTDNTIKLIFQVLWSRIKSLFYGLKNGSRYDVIYVEEVTTIDAILLKLLLRKPMVFEVNGTPEAHTMLGRSKLETWLFKIAEFLIVHYCDKLIAVTPGIGSYLIQTYHVPESKVVVIENGANVELFKPVDTKRARLELGLSPDEFVVIFVGIFLPWQGVDYIIRAAPLIIAKCPNARFLIVGDGPIKDDLLKLAEEKGVLERLIFTGMIPQEKVPLYINASDVCVAPKRPMQTGLSPLKLYEYMACAKPVIATRAKGLDILETIDAGLLVDPEKANEFADAVVRLLQNPEIRKQMGKGGRAYVVENYAWPLVAKRIAQVCKEVITRAKGKGH